MPTAENAQLKMEVAQSLVAYEILTDLGDHKLFDASGAPWSRVAGFAPSVLPNGIKTGGLITPDSSGNNKVLIAALTCNLAGVAISVAAGGLTVTRTAAGGAFQINSITINSAGALANVAGTEGSAFVETRGAAGGPPYIPVGSIEVGQVRLTSNTDALVLASEIVQVPNMHMELASYPLWTVDYLNGQITFVAALPLAHTGDLAKRTYAQYYTPILVALPNVSDFQFPEVTHAVTSVQTYDGTIASSSKSLNQGQFKAKLQDGINDLVVQNKDKILWFQFFPDKNQSSSGYTQGTLGVARTFPPGGLLEAACTISAESKAVEVPA